MEGKIIFILDSALALSGHSIYENTKEQGREFGTLWSPAIEPNRGDNEFPILTP